MSDLPFCLGSVCLLFFGNFPALSIPPRYWNLCHRSHNPFLWHSFLNLHCAHLFCSPPVFLSFSIIFASWQRFGVQTDFRINGYCTSNTYFHLFLHYWSCTSVKSVNCCCILSSGKMLSFKRSHLPISLAGQTSCVRLGLLRTSKPHRQLLCCTGVMAGLADMNLGTNPQAHSMCCLFFLALISFYWLIFTLWVLGVSCEIPTMATPGNRHNRNMREPGCPYGRLFCPKF